MYLFEFLGSRSGSSFLDILKQDVMDYLTPLVAKKVDFITVQDIEDVLRNYKTGLTIDRGLIMKILDPNNIKLVKKIEGDRIYLNVVAAMTDAKSDEEKQTDKDIVKDKAAKQAKKELKK